MVVYDSEIPSLEKILMAMYGSEIPSSGKDVWFRHAF
jgi:hypothetical protein